MLGLGRAMGETMAVTMLIGNSNNISLSLLAPANTISSLLANQFSEASGLQVAALMYAALVLFFLTLVVNILAELIVLRVKRI
jgi:phosphate transport system permease protein